MYHLGLGFCLFLIPAQVIYMRRGLGRFAAVLALSLGLILAARLVILGAARELGEIGPLMLVELFGVLALMGGLAAVNAFKPEGEVKLPALLWATAAVGALSIPLILYLRGSPSFAAATKQLFASLEQSLQGLAAQMGGLEVPEAERLFQPETLRKLMGQFFLRTFAFDYFLLLAFSWWAGSRIGARAAGKQPGVRKLIQFTLPQGYVWPLIASLALILADATIGIGAAGFLAWNVCLVFLFLYGLEGLGILQFLFHKYHLPRSLNWLAVLAVAALAMTPRIGVSILILFPILGVSEIWIRYRREERRDEQG